MSIYELSKYINLAGKFSDIKHLVRCDDDQLMYYINGVAYKYKYKIIKYGN